MFLNDHLFVEIQITLNLFINKKWKVKNYK